MVYVADTATVDEHSIVRDDARVEGDAILEKTELSGSAFVGGHAKVSQSFLKDSGQVYGNATVKRMSITGNSCVFGEASLVTPAYFIELRGSCKIGGKAHFNDLRLFYDFAEKYGKDHVGLTLQRKGYSVETLTLTDVWDMG